MTPAVDDPAFGDGHTIDAVVHGARVTTAAVIASRDLLGPPGNATSREPGGNELLGVDHGDGRVSVAVEDDQRHRTCGGGRAASTHRLQSRPNVVGSTICDSGVHSNGCVQVRVSRRHNCGHRATGGHPGDVDAGRVDRAVVHDL